MVQNSGLLQVALHNTSFVRTGYAGRTTLRWATTKMHNTSLLAVLVWLVFGSSTPVLAAESTLVCGNAKVLVTAGMARGGTPATDFEVTIQRDGQKKVIAYSSENDFLALRCQLDKNGRELLAVNHFCSGSGCAESNWGLVNLETFDVLLKPDQRWKGNHSMAESIVGMKLARIACANFRGAQASGAHCYSVKEM